MRYRDRVRLDRYAKKDHISQPKKDDLVVVTVERQADGKTFSSREIGIVTNSTEKAVTVKLDGTDEIITVPPILVDIVVEKTYNEICKRVGNALYDVESEKLHEDTEDFIKTVIRLMQEEKFIPAGRIQAGLGLEKDLTLFNCYVFAIEEDSRNGIAKHWHKLFDTYSRGGGVGWNLSILRPRGSVVKKVNGRSSGAVSWAEQFSQIAGAVEQGGSRRGAGLQALWCWHPDIMEFISIKAEREDIIDPKNKNNKISRNKNYLSNTNISVLISNEFMQAVIEDKDWDLVFPDLDDPDYDNLWDGSINNWKKHGKKVKVYSTVKARFLWDEIIKRAWESGEPGLIFMDHANEMSNSYYYSELVASNPCGEQILPPNSVCNLAHINLSKFVLPQHMFPTTERTAEEALKEIDWKELERAITCGIRLLDDVIDANKYTDEKVKEQQTSERRIGLGFLGYGEALIRLGLRYGSKEALKFTDVLMEFFKECSYRSSVELSKIRGPFPAFAPRKFTNSGFMRRQTDELRSLIRKYGIRNVTINTVAPTGSTAALLDTSSGCEPFFALNYTSNTRIGIVEEQVGLVADIVERFGKDRSKWPNYVVTAQNGITPENHIETQAIIQKHIDSSISKTVNLPRTASVEDVKTAYTLMWELGCKGGTVYRDGSRDEQVLYSNDQDQNYDEVIEPISEFTTTDFIRPRPSVGLSVTFSEESPIGTVHATIRHDPVTGEPIDVFVNLGKGDASADAGAIGRLISIILRWPNGKFIGQRLRLELVRDQLIDILGRGQVGFGPQAKRSMPDTLAKILDQYLSDNFPLAAIPFGTRQVDDLLAVLKNPNLHEDVRNLLLHGSKHREETETKSDISVPYDYCPKCANYSFVVIPGKCSHCEICGHSQC